MDKKVVILTPCYNGGVHISRFFESILNQSYKNITLIFVDDGSTDNTSDIAKEYGKKLEEKGFGFKYIYKENGGAASAVNVGLKEDLGDYVVMMDSDDTIPPNSIEKRVHFLEENQNYAIVTCKYQIVDEETGEELGIHENKGMKDEENQFENALSVSNVIYPGYMYRTCSFLKAVGREIYANRGGAQNFQMILPMLNSYKCGYIDEVLYTYYERKSSHSHEMGNQIEKIEKYYTYMLDILDNTLKKIGLLEKYQFNLKYGKYRYIMTRAHDAKNKEITIKYYKKLKKLKKQPIEVRLEYYGSYHRLYRWYCYAVIKLKKIFCKKKVK